MDSSFLSLSPNSIDIPSIDESCYKKETFSPVSNDYHIQLWMWKKHEGWDKVIKKKLVS